PSCLGRKGSEMGSVIGESYDTCPIDSAIIGCPSLNGDGSVVRQQIGRQRHIVSRDSAQAQLIARCAAKPAGVLERTVRGGIRVNEGCGPARFTETPTMS